MYSTHIRVLLGQYLVPVVLCTVVLLYLNSAERAHMYPDTCTSKRTHVTLNVIGVEMLRILSYCKIGYECLKIKKKVPEDYWYSGARRSRRLYLRRRRKERHDDTKILVQSVESCIDLRTRLQDPCRRIHGKEIAEAQLNQRRNNRV